MPPPVISLAGYNLKSSRCGGGVGTRTLLNQNSDQIKEFKCWLQTVWAMSSQDKVSVLYRDIGKNGNYYLGFRIQGFGVEGFEQWA